MFQSLPLCASWSSVRYGSDSTDLKAVFAEKYPAAAEEVKAFRRAHGDKKVGEITVDMASIHIDMHMHCSIIIKKLYL